jgi:hypothetical protein
MRLPIYMVFPFLDTHIAGSPAPLRRTCRAWEMQMKRVLVAFVLVLSPLPALADDKTYCATLADMASKYLNKRTRAMDTPDVDTVAAANQCAKGDTAGGIPVLERKLRDAGFTLPPR